MFLLPGHVHAISMCSVLFSFHKCIVETDFNNHTSVKRWYSVGIMHSFSSVGLSVCLFCLSVSSIPQNVMSGLWQTFMGGFRLVQGIMKKILVSLPYVRVTVTFTLTFGQQNWWIYTVYYQWLRDDPRWTVDQRSRSPWHWTSAKLTAWFLTKF